MSDIKLEYYCHYLFPPHHLFQGHRHTGHAEINAVVHGSVQIACADGIYELSEGEAIIIPPNCFHSNRTEDGAEMTVIELTADILPSEPTAVRLGESEVELLKLFSRDLTERGKLSSGEVLYASDEAIMLLTVFLSYISGKSSRPTEIVDSRGSVYREARSYMVENMSRKLTISDIARAAHVCETSLKTAFSRYTGVGVIEYFNGLKLEEAHKMLASGKSCAEVSAALGFSSLAYFSRCFKRYYGVYPSRIKISKK